MKKKKNKLMQEKEYEFKGVPITGTIAAELIKKMFNGKIELRQVIMDAVVKYHINNGGLKYSTTDISHVFKPALRSLKKRGLVSNPSYGYWKVGSVDEPIECVQKEETQNIELYSYSDKIIGEGDDSVYVYYLPIYKKFAEHLKENTWHCKIGKTAKDPLSRILSQSSTALPEVPHVALVIKTDSPTSIESSIHGILRARGKKIDSSPGSEWFLTSPKEVEEIYNFIIQNKTI